MLEQRLDTKVFFESDVQKSQGLVTNSPVQIKFVDRSNGKTPVSPYGTDSQNCSTEYTSSRPYTDGIAFYTPTPESSTLITLEGTELLGLFEGL